jgi:hypothetical protein
MNTNELKDLFGDLFTVVLGVKNPRTGRAIEFSLGRHENKYLYFQPKGSSKQFCYTPHADREGWYYSFTYQPLGKGARTGKATRWTLKSLVPHRVRKQAKARALRLYYKESNG